LAALKKCRFAHNVHCIVSSDNIVTRLTWLFNLEISPRKNHWSVIYFCCQRACK
jgi:hypothetical protein